MSAGAFSLSRYESNAGRVYNVKVQPETLAASIGDAGVAVTNAAPTDPVSEEPSAIVGGSKRTIGVHTRTVRLRFTGAVPDGYLVGSTVTIPALRPAFFEAATKGTEGTYLGVGVQVVGRSGENIV